MSNVDIGSLTFADRMLYLRTSDLVNEAFNTPKLLAAMADLVALEFAVSNEVTRDSYNVAVTVMEKAVEAVDNYASSEPLNEEARNRLEHMHAFRDKLSALG